MYSQTLKGPVHPQDLLLVFGGKLRPRMLLVESVSSAPVDSISANLGSQVAAGSVTHISTPTPTGSTSKTNDSDVNISSILVREIPYAYTSNGGHWTLDGPTVYFTTDDDETSSVEDSDDSHSTKSSHHSLDHYMPPDVGVKAIINPHGRDVLAHYFPTCPLCYDLGWICLAHGGYNTEWPELCSGCSTDQSCPVCMGTTFAWNDKGLLEKLHPYKSQINRYEHNPASMSPAEAQRVKNEALAIATRRYQLTHARNVEMGCLYRKRFESMVEGWKKAWFY